MELERICKGSVAWYGWKNMELERVCKGSVAVAWLEELGTEMCILRFCSDELASETRR